MSLPSLYYKLVKGRVIRCKGGLVPGKESAEWMKWFEQSNRQIAETKLRKVRVSTLFLGLDHGWGLSRKPILFETMAFGGPLDMEMERTCTLKEAKAAHERMVQRVKAKGAP